MHWQNTGQGNGASNTIALNTRVLIILYNKILFDLKIDLLKHPSIVTQATHISYQ